MKYSEEQDKWLKKHNVKEGDKVKVLRKAAYRERGWRRYWNDWMDQGVGKTLIIDSTHPSDGIFSAGYGWFPYFVLEPVKKVRRFRYVGWKEDNHIEYVEFTDGESFLRYKDGVKTVFSIGLRDIENRGDWKEIPVEETNEPKMEKITKVTHKVIHDPTREDRLEEALKNALQHIISNDVNGDRIYEHIIQSLYGYWCQECGGKILMPINLQQAIEGNESAVYVHDETTLGKR